MADDNESLVTPFLAVRRQSEAYCEPLATEDYGLQAMAETSPAKWHLAHTSWFFETFLLKPFLQDYRPFNPQFEYLFNSYYNGIGAQYPRSQRGLLSRPAVDEVYRYRQQVSQAMVALLQTPHPAAAQIRERVELGMHHEQQHQELFFTDLKYNFFQNPLFPAYAKGAAPVPSAPSDKSPALTFTEFDAALVEIGCKASGFRFDNEIPVHPVYLQPYALANRLISNAEFLQFIEDEGYRRPELWLSDGWTHRQQHKWCHPLYWLKRDGQWLEFTLHGLQPLQMAQPVTHISAYEADAFARWSGARLASEFEWERAACATGALTATPTDNAFVNSGFLHPQASAQATGLQQMFGQCWQWTASAYGPYPGYAPASGAIGEYNGKFMCNQLVLRGASCVTDRHHARTSYRNFFYPPDRWQFSGIRLATDL